MNRLVLLLALIGAPVSAATIGPVNNPFTHHDYYINDGVLTWQEARTWALGLGGDLVTIDDSAENAFVTGILPPFPDTFWLGASDAAVEGVFAWASGAPFSYTNWVIGEPDDNVALGGEGDYVVLDRKSGMWSDSNGNFSFPGAIAEVVRPLGVESSRGFGLRAIPVAGRVDVQFELPRTMAVHVGVFDVAGRLVRTVVSGVQDQGTHAVAWEVGSSRRGLYFVSMRAGDLRMTERVAVR